MTENQRNGEVEEPEKDGGANQPESQQQQESQDHQNTENTNLEQASDAPTDVERTQTDHLNKKLLCSFLDRLNQMSSEPTTERIDIDGEDSFEEP